jgi:GH24 family phage-related lysozyme (muramidase)
MGSVKTVSQAGLESVFGHEGVVQGIYNCPAHHATFGMGTLIHNGPSKILDAIKVEKTQAKVSQKTTGDLDFTAYLRTYQKSKKSSGVEYLSVQVGSHKNYKSFVERLIVKGSDTSKKHIAQESKYLEQGWDSYLNDFRNGIQKYEEAVCNAFPDIPLTQRQFDGFFSLTYNIGCNALLTNKSLISAMKIYSQTVGSNSSKNTKDSAASRLLEQILRARPTAPGPVSGKVDKVSYRLTESGVFNSGLFNRRVAEASMIMGHEYSKTDSVIQVARTTIIGAKDHETTETANQQVRTVIDGLNAINRINRGGL